jgi:hypothetical protein
MRTNPRWRDMAQVPGCYPDKHLPDYVNSTNYCSDTSRPHNAVALQSIENACGTVGTERAGGIAK